MSIWKAVQHNQSLEKCKLKLEWDAITYALEWLKEKHKYQIPSAEENAKQLEVSYAASGSKKWSSHFGKQFDSFLKR